MPSLVGKEKTKSEENCGTQATKNDLLLHKESCRAGNSLSEHCPIFFFTSQADLKHRIAKKHRVPKSIVTFKCNICYQYLPGFYALRQHKNTHKGFPIKTTNVEPDRIINDVDNMIFKELMSTFFSRFLILNMNGWDTKYSIMQQKTKTRQ